MLDSAGSAGELSRQEQQILDETDRFARGELYPLAARMDREEWWPDDLFTRLGAAGYLGIDIPEAYGGQGLDLFAAGLVLQAIARWNHAVALSWVAHDNLCVDNLHRNGSEEQRLRFLPGLCRGESVGALALTEPGAGSDAIGSMRTTARRDGDDYLLNARLPASRSRRNCPRWDFAAARPLNWSSRTAGSRPPTCSAKRARALRC
jgi:isovaleryl-CoA dehydrogenase